MGREGVGVQFKNGGQGYDVEHITSIVCRSYGFHVPVFAPEAIPVVDFNVHLLPH